MGYAVPGLIVIDQNAAGYGWFIDATPADDAEFRPLGQEELVAVGSSPAFGKMDLLSVVMHEMGHALGFDHDDHGVMEEFLEVGVRHLPEPVDAPAVLSAADSPDHATAFPIDPGPQFLSAAAARATGGEDAILALVGVSLNAAPPDWTATEPSAFRASQGDNSSLSHLGSVLARDAGTKEPRLTLEPAVATSLRRLPVVLVDAVFSTVDDNDFSRGVLDGLALESSYRRSS